MIKPVATYHIHITGLVQGVGFRPQVYQLAMQHQMHGWVKNSNDGVHIEFTSTEEKAYQFYNEVIATAPALSVILHHAISKTFSEEYASFTIRESDDGPVENLLLTPDYAMCADCKQEMNDPGDRRYQYPFITCTNCGPRYSILHQLPYDRANTLMKQFEMCSTCEQEYNDPTNRRHYAQTNSCDACGISLAAFTSKRVQLQGDNKSIVQTVIDALVNQQIVAVKAIGGYLLLCDATNKETVASLRERKHRPSKPFALLYSSIESVKNDFVLSPQEADALQSPAAPIVLLQKKATQLAPESASPTTGLASDVIAPGLSQSPPWLVSSPTTSLASGVIAPGLSQSPPWLVSSPTTSLASDAIAPGLSQSPPWLVSSPTTSLASGVIAPGLSQLGVMLPSAPLLSLIATGVNRPLIATSANVSDSPIIYKDEEALEQLAGIADVIITHNRGIVTPQDDSVIRFADGCQQKILLRRSRGMAPSYFGYATKRCDSILATGALMKSSFTFTNNGNTFISQYLGNTDSYEAQESYKKTLHHFIALFHQQPQVVIADKHPLYFSTELAKQLAAQYECPLVQVQHHKAHAAAVLAENDLLKSDAPVLCVIWDGTGLGDDRNSWGGEFFVYENNALHRRYHFDYFPVIQGDKMAREPRLSALAVCSEVWMAEDALQSKFTATEFTFYQKLLANDHLLQCSSVGRIFDAVASLLNLCDKQSYEGEAALLLETLAHQYFAANGYQFTESYFMPGAHLHKIPTATLFAGIITDMKKGKSASFIAAKFHYSLAQLVYIVANNVGLQQIAFSGGVFQNAVLVSLLQFHYGQTLRLYFHKALSPNDENISFGQMAYYDHDIDGIRTTIASAMISNTMTVGIL